MLHPMSETIVLKAKVLKLQELGLIGREQEHLLRLQREMMSNLSLSAKWTEDRRDQPHPSLGTEWGCWMKNDPPGRKLVGPGQGEE